MEESHKEADGAGGEEGGGRGGMKLPGLCTESLASALGRVKALARLCEDSIRARLRKPAAVLDDAAPCRSNPIDILKRLQREAFFEIMKLRDRQDKVERTFASFKTGKRSPFREEGTHMMGLVDVAGALFVGSNTDQTVDVLKIAGIRTGIDSIFVFETVTRQRDTLMTEFAASQDILGSQGDVPRSPLALSKVLYSINVNNRLSLITIPLGARCRDFGFGRKLQQGFTEPSSFWPPLLNQSLGFAAGVRVKCSSITASVAQAVPSLDMQLFSPMRRPLGTFGQVAYEIFAGTRVSLLGIWQMPGLSRPVRIATLAVPMGTPGSLSGAQTEVVDSPPSVARGSTDDESSGSLAVMLESEFDDCSRIRGWVELQKPDMKNLQWALSLSDTPEDEVGWALNIGGNIGGDQRRVQLEAFLKVGLAYKLAGAGEDGTDESLQRLLSFLWVACDRRFRKC
ncbi:hypothetical protein Taro_019496 [Colocasia esculenta]|uniref:Uncharacterized protein n=1 Tax=Colocasia esculenta TaxID=4460 RepID=A0A843UTP0_COLES|nr:hypothetical protein [Colocasia esculenta]